MKLNNTYLLFDAGSVSKMEGWKIAHTAIETAVKGMVWPAEAKTGLVLPRIVSIKQGGSYTDLEGNSQIWNKPKPLTLRNGVVPLKDAFRKNLETAGWNAEAPLSLKPYFEKIRADKSLAQITRYPTPPPDAVYEPFHEGVGDFDFSLRSESGFRTVIEWETGNISSSHRSLNKICLALMSELVDAAVVIVPSNKLYVHLTDRVGNIKELQPYFYFWSAFGRSLKKGLLAIIEVEQDDLIKSTDMREFIPRGEDGNALRASSQQTVTPPARKRAQPKA